VASVDIAASGVMPIELCATRTVHHRSRDLRGKLFAPIPHCIFTGGPVALIAPSLEIGLGPLGQENAPCIFKAGAGLFECRGGAALVFARLAAMIEAYRPFSGILIKGNAGDG
jgi:hypothetical protein